MTPKQKAEELFDKMSTNNGDEHHHCTQYVAQQCALIAVDEILEATKRYDYTLGPNPTYNAYWLKVKYQIEKI